MRFSLLFVGDEVVEGLVENTNLSVARAELALWGISVDEVMEVRDDDSMIAEALRFLLSYSQGVLVSGGLGPTEDDLTREAVAGALNRRLVFVKEIWEDIEAKLRARGVPVREGHRKMALIPDGARYVLNPVGLAPAFWIDVEGKVVVALPAVPWEFRVLLRQVLPLVSREGETMVRRVFKFFGVKESELNSVARELLSPYPVKWGTVVDCGEVWLNVKGEPKVLEQIDRILRRRFGELMFGTDDDTLGSVVGGLLREAGLTLSVAESCTGGLLASMVTDVSGSSDYFRGGVVAYLEEVKASVLGVSWDSIRSYTVYSHQVAKEMASGVRALMGSDIGLSTTGIAGPTGGTPDKPVGLVYVGFATDDSLQSFEYRYSYDRIGNKRAFAKSALDVLRRYLLKICASS